jgi:hypothetical protein
MASEMYLSALAVIFVSMKYIVLKQKPNGSVRTRLSLRVSLLYNWNFGEQFHSSHWNATEF